MVNQGPKIDIASTFHDVITAKYPSANISSFNAKRLSQNTRILLTSDANIKGIGKGNVLKLKKVTSVVVPRIKYVPLCFTTQKKGIFVLGVRLTAHGGEIAVELARKLAKKASMQLVVLGTNVIAIFLVGVPLKISINHDDPSSNPQIRDAGRGSIEEIIETLRKVSDEFHARIETLLSGFN